MRHDEGTAAKCTPRHIFQKLQGFEDQRRKGLKKSVMRIPVIFCIFIPFEQQLSRRQHTHPTLFPWCIINIIYV